MHPRMVDKIIVISPDIGAFKRKLPTPKVARMLINGLKSDIHKILRYAFYSEKMDKEMRRALDCVEKMFRYYPMTKIDYTKQLFAALFFNTWRTIGEIQHHTLIMTGDQDKIVSSENAVRLAKLLDNSTLTIIPKCGHFFFYNDLKPLLPELYEFFEEKSK
jgi:pimeloyl-ACP methyl ester carboxylesterase